MNSELVVAASAVVIALVALGLSVYQASLERKHQRLSVQPLLLIGTFEDNRGGRCGVHLSNVGFGPARVTKSEVWRGEDLVGRWDRSTMQKLSDNLDLGDAGVGIYNTSVVAAGFEEEIYFIDQFDPDNHSDFVQMLNGELDLKIEYESLYGEATYFASLNGRERL